LTVFRSNTGLFVQLIDDTKGVTLVSLSSKGVKPAAELTGKTAVAFSVGQELAEKAKTAGITEVVFDRAGFRYHGRVKAVADGARAAGLVF
jgi:large subunit ribosomal protein L18